MGAILAAMLLLIFMISQSPMISPGQGIDTHRWLHPTLILYPDDEKIVAVLRDGTIYYGQNRVTPEVLLRGLIASGKKTSNIPLYVKADTRVKYGSVVTVIDAAHDAGIQRIAFITEYTRGLY
jgi:biopolymer transport protein ExbD